MDVKDVYCVDKLPSLLKIVPAARPFLEGWDCRFSEDDEKAVLMFAWEFYILGLFGQGVVPDDSLRLNLVSNFGYNNFMIEWFKDVSEGTDKWPQYCLAGNCALMIEQAFLAAANDYSGIEDKRWSSINKHMYMNTPFSSIDYIKEFFTKESPAPGNPNTINVANYFPSAYPLTKTISTIGAANYRQVIDLGGKAGFSIDGGQSSSPLSGHYFDQNKLHLSGGKIDMTQFYS